MLAKINSRSIVEPFNNGYHHALVIASNSPLRMSPVRSACLPDTMQGPADQTWASLIAAIEATGMGPENIVEISVYLVDRDDEPAFAARLKYFGDARSASSALLVGGLLDPGSRLETDAVAAAPARACAPDRPSRSGIVF